MLTHEEMIGLQAEKHDLIDPIDFESREKYVLHLIHSFAYTQAAVLAQDKEVLDLGCNTGYGTEILSRSARKVVGVDVSDGAVAQAKSKYGNQGIEFHCIDGKSLPFEDGRFDLIVSCQVIEHIVDHDVFLNELKRVLSPTGAVLFTTPNSVLRLDPGMKPWNKFHVREFDSDQLKALLEAHFGHVGVLGLFATESTYEVEKKRVTTARERARKRQLGGGSKPRPWWKKILPRNLFSRKKKKSAAIVKASQSEAQSVFIEQHGLEDFHYSAENMACALDLLAICSNSDGVISEFEHALKSVPSVES